MIKLLLALLRYPGEPADPDGSPGSVRVLSASPRYLAYRLLTMWAGLLIAFAVEHSLLHRAIKGPAPLVATVAVLVVLVGIPGSVLTFLAYAEYSVRSYKLSDRALRIREGLLIVRETTMTFANIQNVSVSRGPIQGLFGISDVVLKTAGGGAERRKGLAPDLHVAHFHGLTNADEVRDLVLDLLRKAKSTGLGDADDAAPPSAALSIDAAVADLRAAATAFRETAEDVSVHGTRES